MSDTESFVICIAFPPLTQTRHLDALRAIDPRIEPLPLPTDPGANFMARTAIEPHDEPPPWGIGVAHERAEILARSDALVALHTPDRLPDLMPRLRWIQGIGAGIEQFAKAGVPAEGVRISNASGIGARSMSEWVIGRLLQVWKRFPESDALQREGIWKQTYGRTFADSVVGVVGLGHIGSAVAERARALGARVLATRRTARAGDTSPVADALYPLSELHAMLAECDAVVVAAPATPETHHLIDARAIAAMKPGAMLVNVARGSLVDESALVDALESEHVSWAALDVFEVEPLPEASPLWGHPRALVTAHSSPSVDRYMDDVFEIVLENVRRFARGEPLVNEVDPKLLGFGAL
jgi:phosphoglycerate dehydrogenase-like enzyme